MISAIKDLVAASPVPVVFDHFGGAQAELGVDQPGFADLLELVKSGKAYVKISGAYRASKLAPDYPDAAPLARALIAANADRIVWGTDWPHPDHTPPGKKADRRDAAVPDRRRPSAQSIAGVGAGRGDPQKNPGRQSGAALRVLRTGCRRPPAPFAAALSSLIAAQPVGGLAQAPERKQMESGNRRRRGSRRRSQAAHDIIRPGIGQAAGRNGRSGRAARASNCRRRSGAQISSAWPGSPDRRDRR